MSDDQEPSSPPPGPASGPPEREAGGYSVRLIGDRVIAAIGDNARNIIHLIDQKLLRRIHRTQLFGFGVLILLTAGVIAMLAIQFQRAPRMPAGFRIAVAGFAENGRLMPAGLGQEVAENIKVVLSDNLEDVQLTGSSLKKQFYVWGPYDGSWRKVGSIRGRTRQARAAAARDLAARVGADLVVYGVVDDSQPVGWLAPEFYVNYERFQQFQEITGQFDLGTPITLTSWSEFDELGQMDQQVLARCLALAHVVNGVARYVDRDYDLAGQSFLAADQVPDWQADQGKEVLYVLAANTLLRRYELAVEQAQSRDPHTLDQAQAWIDKALAIDPEYARAWVSLGSLDLQRAVLPMGDSDDSALVDQAWLNLGLETQQRALQAQNRSPWAEIEARVRFNRAKLLFWQADAAGGLDYSAAQAEYAWIIQEYERRPTGPEKRRLQDMAANSHADLAIIAWTLEDYPQALAQFDQAIDLLKDLNPERAKMLAAVRAYVPTPLPAP